MTTMIRLAKRRSGKVVTALLGTLVFCSIATAQNMPTQHWPLDDGEGFEVRNLADGGYEGLLYNEDIGGLGEDGSVWVDDAERGTVLGFNGTNGWMDGGVLPIMTLENDFTWAFWGKLPEDQPSPNNDIVIGSRWGENGSDTSPREFIKFTPNRFEYHLNGGFGDDLAYADSNLPLDQWVYNSVVKDGDQLTYYRDGEFKNSTTITGGQASGEALTIGFGGDVGSQGGEAWRGSLSDVQLYTTALSPAQISTAMTGELVGDADLFAHYPLDDGGDSDVVMGTGPGAVEDGAIIGDINSGLGEDGNVWVDDPDRGTVLTLAGTYVEAVEEAPLFDLENDFTWNFWSKSDGGQAQTSNTIIMGNRFDFSGTDNGEWIKFTNNRIEYHADGTNESDLEWGAAGPDDNRIPNDDNWYHHVVVKDGDEMKYYRNGELRNGVTLGLGQQSADPMPFALGGQGPVSGGDGRETPMVYLSDVRLYEAAITPAEIAALAGIELATCNDATSGDIDGNGKVEFADFLVLSNNFGNDVSDPEGHLSGDLDCNGKVEFADFLVLSNSFGQEVGAEASSVPEPSSLTLLGLSVLCLGLVRRRRN